MSVRVRPATERDCPAIAEITNHAIETGYAHFGTEPDDPEEVAARLAGEREVYPWFVAEDNGGRVAGFSRASAWKSRGAYAWTCESAVYVSPAARGRGIGKLLYARLFAELERRGFRCVVAGVVVPNAASERLHEAMGMIDAGTLPGVGFKLGAWRDVRYYVKTLGGDGPPAERPGRPGGPG